MGHEILSYVLFLKGLKHKISKLAIKKDMASEINHIHLADIRQRVVKIKKAFGAF